LCMSGTPHHVRSSTSCLVMPALPMKSPFIRRSLYVSQTAALPPKR
ncbi:unnamed protein product, partial [Tetraodon nigroviridis]